ncbi:TPA: restriction endonuclease subunit S [Staphylococcus aureus]|nr:restriction endonuclease subunit S [Staphylococcus aureus]
MSNTQKKNVPELRFPGFEGEYSLDIFGNLATNKSEKFNPQNENASIDIELDCIEQNTGRLIKIYNSKEFSSQKNKFNPQNVLYGKLRPYLNKYYFTKKSGVCSSEIWVLKSTKEDKLLNLFLYYFIQTKRYSDVASKSAGSKMPRADWGLIENIRVYFPELCEQQKIGQFFSKLDRQIELEEQKLELLQQQKKGYMQKIFSQELRFKDENGKDYPDWEEENLGDLLIEVSDKTTTNNQYTLLSSTKNGLKSQEEYFKKQIASKDSTGYKILRLNQLVLSPQNLWLGNININQQFDFGIVSPSYKVYTLKNNFDIQFAKDLLKSPKYIYEYALASEQGASIVRRNLNLDLFHFIKVNLPDLVEQKKIGFFLSEVDASIKMQSLKLNLLNKRKKGLLQKVFL